MDTKKHNRKLGKMASAFIDNLDRNQDDGQLVENRLNNMIGERLKASILTEMTRIKDEDKNSEDSIVTEKSIKMIINEPLVK